MGKKVIRLTESELHGLIVEATKSVSDEMDAKSYSRTHNTSIHNGQDERDMNGVEKAANDDTIDRANALEPHVQRHWLKDYIGKTFKFFGEDGLNLVAHVLFTFEEVKKLDWKKTILIGTVTYNQTQISGDGIIIDFTKNRVQYREPGSRCACDLEIDNRFKPLWDNFTDELKTALNERTL